MADPTSTSLIERLQAANPRNHNQMWDLGTDLSRHFGRPPFHSTGSDNPVLSIDASKCLIMLTLGNDYPHLFMSLNGLMNSPCELWRAEIGWPQETYRGKAKSPALALCIALLRANERSQTNCDATLPSWLQAEPLPQET